MPMGTQARFCPDCGTGVSQGAKFCAVCGAHLEPSMESPARPEEPSQPQTQTPQPQVAVPRQYAGFWFRTLAFVIDIVLVQVASAVIVVPLAFSLGASMAFSYSEEEISAAGGALGFVIGLLAQWLWFTVSESSKWQATPGKKMLGLKVTDEHGERIGFGRANARYWSKILSGVILFIGFLMIGFTRNKQGLHDQIADTFVVRDTR